MKSKVSLCKSTLALTVSWLTIRKKELVTMLAEHSGGKFEVPDKAYGLPEETS